MSQRIGIDGDVEVTSQVQQRANILRVENTLFVKTVFFLMDSHDFSDKKVMIPVSADFFQPAFKTNIGIIDDRRLDDSGGAEFDWEFIGFDKVKSRFPPILGGEHCLFCSDEIDGKFLGLFDYVMGEPFF